MQFDKRNRTELKQFFTRNAIPTESHFADFIDAMLNQRDDGIVKLPNDPLSIEAVGDDTSQKKALNFYNSFRDNDPQWVVSLNPRQDPANAATARPGFSIGEAAGVSRLFIERGTGRVGLGTVGPLAGALHIDRGATNDLALLLSSSGPGWGSGLQLRNTASGAKTFGIYAGSDGALHFADASAAKDRILIGKEGDVGVGIAPAGAKLHVAGTVKANRFTSDNTHVLNDYTTANPPSNVYLYSPPNDRDAWIYLDSADTGSNWGIYHRQIDNPGAVKGLPANSIGFVGGGSRLQAFIGLGDGAGYFAGNVGIGTLTPRGRLDVKGEIWMGQTLNVSGPSNGTNAGILNIHNETNSKYWHITHRSGEEDKLIFWRNDASATPWLAALKLGMTGMVEAPNGALIAEIGLGTQNHGKVTYPYETIQLHPGHNLRIWFGTKERFVLQNDGTFTIKFDQGRWVFQPDGNLVKYDNANKALWALNIAAGKTHWS